MHMNKETEAELDKFYVPGITYEALVQKVECCRYEAGDYLIARAFQEEAEDRYFTGHTVAEVARKMHTTRGRVRSQLGKVLKRKGLKTLAGLRDLEARLIP
jgi:hypothetical protein